VRSFLRAHGVHDVNRVAKLEYRAGEWPGKMRAELTDGQVFELEKFYANYLIPFHIMARCLTCTDLTNEFADISGGDAWAPVYEERGMGWSLVVGRTEPGQQLLDDMQRDGVLSLQATDEHDAMMMHSHMLDFKKRGAFLRMARLKALGRKAPRYDYEPLDIPLKRRLFEWAIDAIFLAGRIRLIHRVVEALPVKWTGRVFMWARDRWKKLTYRTKRQGMQGLRFQYALNGQLYCEDGLPVSNNTGDKPAHDHPGRTGEHAKGLRLGGMWERAKLEWHYMTQRTWTLQAVGEHWDATEEYDDVNAETFSYFLRFVDGLAHCTIPPQSRVLDICCRTGNGTAYFYQHNKVRYAICADVSARFLQVAHEYLDGLNIPHETLLFTDYKLDLPDDSVEAILCFETLEHIAEPQPFLNELARVLEPGGELLLTTPNILWEPVHWLAAIIGLHHSEGPHRFLSHRKLTRVVQQAGFIIEKDVGTVLIPDGPRWLTALGRRLEQRFPRLAWHLGLRRILICRK
jgi:SAM-dependent methyltransferase